MYVQYLLYHLTPGVCTVCVQGAVLDVCILNMHTATAQIVIANHSIHVNGTNCGTDIVILLPLPTTGNRQTTRFIASRRQSEVIQPRSGFSFTIHHVYVAQIQEISYFSHAWCGFLPVVCR